MREIMGTVPEITSQRQYGIVLPLFTLSHCTNPQRQSGISDEPEALPLLLPHLLFSHLNSQTRLT